MKTKERKLDRATPTTKLLTFLSDDDINSHADRSNGMVTVPDNTVRSALNNFTDEKNTPYYIPFKGMISAFQTPPQSFSRGIWEVAFG